MSMDIEDLNKSQIILLTLLVSFVTSIATGIVTVSLMEKAPKDVVRVVQRVVEKTVEKVDNVSPLNKPKEVVVQEKTIIVDNSNRLTGAITTDKNKVLKIYEKDSEKFVAFAVPVGTSTALTDAGVIDKAKKYIIKVSKDNFRDVSIIKDFGVRSLAKLAVNSDTKLREVLINKDDPKLGTKVFMFKNTELDSIATGIISKVTTSSFDVEFNNVKVIPGTPVFDYNGMLVGMSTAASRKDSELSFIKSVALDAIDTVTASKDIQSHNGTTTDATTTKTNLSKKDKKTSQSAAANGSI